MTDQQVDDFLEHFGVKGMRWGQRKANRALNKEYKQKQKAEAAAEMKKLQKSLRAPTKTKAYDTSTPEGKAAYKEARRNDIDRARERINTGAARADRKDAKNQYKVDKVNMGSKAAKDILRAKRNELYVDSLRAQEYRDGTEVAVAIIGAVGNALLSSLKAPAR